MTEQDLIDWLTRRHPGLQFLGGLGMWNAGNREGPRNRETAVLNYLYYSEDEGRWWRSTDVPVSVWCHRNERIRLELESTHFPLKQKKEAPKSMATEAEIRAKGRALA